ncbi:MAG: hypothetical protein A3J38_02065 [Gammaproteobacteria bacterium RIFCSPHIGHO2_12_FULL_45_9]|nr:MAG: hypothetical protein A3J38_02065 [Gammaproteobacteria bacterium RIFCSPHIGHO2_12_FULL_45_9]
MLIPTDPVSRYYDSEYPDPNHPVYPENTNCFKEYSLLQQDIPSYLTYAEQVQAHHILELCCGSGRVAIPLAHAGYTVTGVDLSQQMLSVFKQKLSAQPAPVQQRITLIHGDAGKLDTEQAQYDLIILAFNSFVFLEEETIQRAVLQKARTSLKPGGTLLLDNLNPAQLNLNGWTTPKPHLERRCIYSGNRYIRSSCATPMNAQQQQTLYGYYTEYLADGSTQQSDYQLTWRILFYEQLQSMLKEAGFSKQTAYGYYFDKPFSEEDRHIFMVAK